MNPNYVSNIGSGKGFVIYLTLDGKKASSHDGQNYLRISYSTHILAWLEKCLQATYDIIPINQVLIQYRSLVRQLTGQNMEAQAMKDIVKFLESNTTIIENFDVIKDGIDRVRCNLLGKIADALIDRLSDQYIVTRRANMGAGEFGDLVIQPRQNDFASGHQFEIWIEHLSMYSEMVIGIAPRPKSGLTFNQSERQLLDLMNEKMAVKCEQKNIHKAKPVKTWHGNVWPIGWGHLIPHPNFLKTNTHLSHWLNEKEFENQIKEVAVKVHDYMNILKDVYHDAKLTLDAQGKTPS